MEIRPLHRDTITEGEADQLAQLRTLADPRRLRTDPPVSRQLAVNDLRASGPSHAFTYSGLFDDDRLIGVAETFGAVSGANTDVCEIGIWVEPGGSDFDRHHQLFAHVDAQERAAGRTRYWGWGDMALASTRDFWTTELGYSMAYEERISRCALADTDPELMQQWIDNAAVRASGYHLVSAVMPFDDQAIEYFRRGLEAMNDAPLDDILQEHEPFDTERARAVESIFLATKSTLRSIFAIETATGALAGYSAVRIPDAEPSHSHQNDTVTVAAHRNKGIGRWMKASMWQWLRAEHPQVTYLETGNAESNRAMLAINEAMGFRDVMHHAVWHKLGAESAS